MEKVVFIPEWSGAVHRVKISITEEQLRHGPRYPPEMVGTVASVMWDVQQRWPR